MTTTRATLQDACDTCDVFYLNLRCCVQEDHSEAVQRELGIEIAKDEEEDEEEEHPGN